MLSTDVVEKVHGGRSKCDKRGTRAEWFKFKGKPNLDSIIERDEHRWRRQVWEKAFSTKGMYDPALYVVENEAFPSPPFQKLAYT